MRKVFRADFFDRSALVVARDLLGKYLVRAVGGREVALKITETEAYQGLKDRVSHARSGKTARNAPMYGPSGRVYVYFTYGMHWMLNLVCGKEAYPAAVLIRGAGDVVGPARLTKFLKIDRSLNEKPLGKASGLWVEDRGEKIPPRMVRRTGRIGVEHAGEWARKPWRFVILPQKQKRRRGDDRGHVRSLFSRRRGRKVGS